MNTRCGSCLIQRGRSIGLAPSSQTQLAKVQLLRQKYEQAEVHCRRAIAIQEVRLGAAHPNLIESQALLVSIEQARSSKQI